MSFFNSFHDWCETDSGYKSCLMVLFLLIKCQVHKCLSSRQVDYGLHLVTTLLCCLSVKAEGGFCPEGFRPRGFCLGLLSGGLRSGGLMSYNSMKR